MQELILELDVAIYLVGCGFLALSKAIERASPVIIEAMVVLDEFRVRRHARRLVREFERDPSTAKTVHPD